MEPSSDLQKSNGAAAVPTVSAPCPLNDLPQNLHEYIHKLENRITELETALQNFGVQQEKNREAMRGMGKIFFQGPAKMFIAALPKDMQAKLTEFFGEVTP